MRGDCFLAVESWLVNFFVKSLQLDNNDLCIICLNIFKQTLNISYNRDKKALERKKIDQCDTFSIKLVKVQFIYFKIIQIFL